MNKLDKLESSPIVKKYDVYPKPQGDRLVIIIEKCPCCRCFNGTIINAGKEITKNGDQLIPRKGGFLSRQEDEVLGQCEQWIKQTVSKIYEIKPRVFKS